MDKVEFVLRLRRYGVRINIVHDYWGCEHMMLRLPPFGWPRFKLRLGHQQAVDLKARLRRESRPRVTEPSPTAGRVANQTDGL